MSWTFLAECLLVAGVRQLLFEPSMATNHLLCHSCCDLTTRTTLLMTMLVSVTCTTRTVVLIVMVVMSVIVMAIDTLSVNDGYYDGYVEDDVNCDGWRIGMDTFPYKCYVRPWPDSIDMRKRQSNINLLPVERNRSVVHVEPATSENARIVVPTIGVDPP